MQELLSLTVSSTPTRFNYNDQQQIPGSVTLGQLGSNSALAVVHDRGYREGWGQLSHDDSHEIPSSRSKLVSPGTFSIVASGFGQRASPAMEHRALTGNDSTGVGSTAHRLRRVQAQKMTQSGTQTHRREPKWIVPRSKAPEDPTVLLGQKKSDKKHGSPITSLSLSAAHAANFYFSISPPFAVHRLISRWMNMLHRRGLLWSKTQEAAPTPSFKSRQSLNLVLSSHSPESPLGGDDVVEQPLATNSVNVRDIDGQTALLWAAKKGQLPPKEIHPPKEIMFKFTSSTGFPYFQIAHPRFQVSFAHSTSSASSIICGLLNKHICPADVERLLFHPRT